MGVAMRRRHRGFAWVIAGLLGAMQANARVDEFTEAIWKVQQIDLRMRTGDSYYSCASLQSKIAAILNAVGAAKVVVNVSCQGAPTNYVWASVATTTPVPATPANVRAATTYDGRAQLIARLREATLPTANDVEVFPARWRKVSVVSIRRIGIGPGDCDLLRGLSEQIFPHLELRVVRKNFNCGQQIIRPILVVEALMQSEA